MNIRPSALTAFVVCFCDRCGSGSMLIGELDDVRAEFTANGWREILGRQVCPVCFATDPPEVH